MGDDSEACGAAGRLRVKIWRSGVKMTHSFGELRRPSKSLDASYPASVIKSTRLGVRSLSHQFMSYTDSETLKLYRRCDQR